MVDGSEILIAKDGTEGLKTNPSTEMCIEKAGVCDLSSLIGAIFGDARIFSKSRNTVYRCRPMYIAVQNSLFGDRDLHHVRSCHVC